MEKLSGGKKRIRSERKIGMKSERPSLSWLADPRVFEVNREEAHSDHLFYETAEEAERGGEMPLRQSLDGSWLFRYAEHSGERPADFYRQGFDCSGWETIEVPGHIQTQGWGRPQYTNTLYPWDGVSALRPPEVFMEENPVGSYLKEFELKPELRGKRIFLRFEGVETAFYVWVNGHFAGYSEDSFAPAEFEVTRFLHEGKNRVAAEAWQYGSASWIQDQDFWRFSGIFRGVSLAAVPAAHVRDLSVTCELPDSLSSAAVHVRLKLKRETDAAVRADISLKDSGGTEVASAEGAPCGDGAELTLPLENPRLWSAEDPYLYRLLIRLHDGNGRTFEAVPEKIGIRRFRMENGVMRLNGKRIVFRGVNRHEFDCRRGRAVTKEDMLWDILFLKRNNINAVRTSHYPNRSEWYRLCDEYGIYLIDETNLESHGSWQKPGETDPDGAVPGDREEWLGAVLDRAKSMLERDKNHPSVLIWSCGNESFGGLDLYRMSQYFRGADPTRLVHYEGVFHDRRYNGTSDMESRMYAKPAEIEKYLKKDPEKPYISCEYMHAMGNSCGGMHLYAELEDRYEKYQGGFLWDFIDQALVKKDEAGREFLAYGGDFGDRPTDYEFCGDGIVYADRTPSPKVQEVRFLYQSVRLLPDEHGVLVRNRNLFVPTDGFYLEYTLLRGGEPVFSGTAECPVPAGEERYFRLPLPKPDGGEYALNCSLRHKEDCLWAEKGYEQAFGQHVWTAEGAAPEKTADSAPLRVVRGDGNIGAYGDGFSVLFSLQAGGIVSLRKNGTETIARPPMPVYWRAPTDNDRGNGSPFRSACWYAAEALQKCSGAKVTEECGTVTAEYEYELPAPEQIRVRVSYTARPDGSVLVHARFPGAKKLPELPLFGLGFRIKRRFGSFRYYGLGPEENYADRRCGARLGIFESTARENLARYLMPQECGNRTGVRWAEVAADDGSGLRFSAAGEPFELGVLPYSASELGNALHRRELPEPSYTYVRILAKQAGVGGDDSWGAPVHDEYRIPSGRPIELSFVLEPLG